MMGPIYCVGSERAVAYPRAPSLSSFSFNNFFTSSLFHFFSSYFLFFHFCPDFPKENSNSQSKQRNLPAMSKPKRKHQTQKQWPQIWKHQTQIKSHFETNPKTQNKNLLFRNTKPKSNFIFQTPNPDLDGKIGGQLWW